MVELYFIVMSVSAGVLAGALSVILYLDRPPRSGNNGASLASQQRSATKPTREAQTR